MKIKKQVLKCLPHIYRINLEWEFEKMNLILIWFWVFLLECDALIPGCKYCTSVTKTGTYLNFYCSTCHAGLFLFTNSTRLNSLSYIYTACVLDCPTASPAYVNDPNKGICQSCGQYCSSCTLQNGCSTCLASSNGNGYSSALDSTATYSTAF